MNEELKKKNDTPTAFFRNPDRGWDSFVAGLK